MRIYLIGYPGDVGGANTECWHLIKLWRQCDFEVCVVPTYGAGSPHWNAKLNAIGVKVCASVKGQLRNIPGLAGSIAVGMCNAHFYQAWSELTALQCKLVSLNCMTFLFPHEVSAYGKQLPHAMVYQSHFQQDSLEKRMPELVGQGTVIRGAFCVDEFPLNPKPHAVNSPFCVGRMARGDVGKWSSNLWSIYRRIQYPKVCASVMGVNELVKKKLGPSPPWAEVLPVNAKPAKDFLRELHCLLPVNGGAKENWPRAGLEAFSAGVPVVTQNNWGWREMVIHGETGFLGSCDEELAHYAACLAYDENLRQKIVHNAYSRLVDELANPSTLGEQWTALFARL